MPDEFFSIEKPTYIPFFMEDVDRNSLEDIKRCIEKGYKSKDQVKDHLAFLEKLENKLHEIRTAEESNGVDNTELDEDIKEVRGLLGLLEEIFHKIVVKKSKPFKID